MVKGSVPYAELHAHSNFSFLDGASHAEELAEEAARLGLDALALTDHDGLYGVVRFAEAARELGLPTVFGSELTLNRTRPQLGIADPGVDEPNAPTPPGSTKGRRVGAVDLAELDLAPGLADTGSVLTAPGGAGAPPSARRRGWGPAGGNDPGETHVLALARDPRGYAMLTRAISEGQLRGEKGAPACSLADLATLHASDPDHWLVLTGCRKGAVARALVEQGPAAAAHELRRLIDAFGRHNVAVELTDHGHPLDTARNDALAELAVTHAVDLVATNNVHYATPKQRPLAAAMAAVRARRSLDEIDGWLPAAAGAHLRSGAEQARRFARYPGVVERAGELGRACAFDLSYVAPDLPPFPCPDGLDEMGYLRRLTEEGATRRYGPRDRARVERAYEQIDHELEVIEKLGFPGYFLVVWDLVEFCRRSNILCQGRGSAANSAVCFALGITNADAVSLGLLFERFLSPGRDGPPDIDIDIESDRREEVIQYVYDRHGRSYAAQVANVITYRAKSSVRDMAKALGYSVGQQDAWSKHVDRWSTLAELAEPARAEQPDRARTDPAKPAGGGLSPPQEFWIPPAVLRLAREIEHFPRHLGIHSGGMVMCDRPVIEVCPVEWARMEGRSVLQWDKDDCAAAGLVKFDLLGLGMLSALHYAIDFIRDAHGVEVDLATIPQDPAVYDMLCEADTVGVFQIESRAQMATLPRLRPRCFYDLVVEVALIRPGPIQGGSVHPYIRRRNGTEPVTYLHPSLEPSLSKTLGVPLFQEQLMQISIDVAGFTPAEADMLRQAMGSKRSRERMERLRQRFHDGTRSRGITQSISDQIWDKLAAFANYGFPESHSVSFAYLVYASSWIKRYYPAAFCAALLDAQPMGFYSPHSLVQDARRHGVVVHTPCINTSRAGSSLEYEGSGPSCEAARAEARDRHPSATYPFGGRIPSQPAVRLGLEHVRGVGAGLAELLVAERDANGPFRDMEDLKRRADMRAAAAAKAGSTRTDSTRTGAPRLTLEHLEALATAGAFGCFGPHRREALWGAGAVAQTGADRLEGIVTGVRSPPLPGMTGKEEASADLWATGVSPEGHPTRFIREDLDERGVVTAEGLRGLDDGRKVLVGGVVTHRQRPATASGITFMNVEDETGLINVVCSRGCWNRYRKVARVPALLIRGRLEKVEGVINVVAEKLEPLPIGTDKSMSRDFR
ncbi:MAG: error-prone DNA polymerase [Actinobacteria bacterium]|nr:error-prone DNA polymerase [Actinomycetota bacterium]